jgi:hypothetical protein
MLTIAQLMHDVASNSPLLNQVNMPPSNVKSVIFKYVMRSEISIIAGVNLSHPSLL